MVEVYKYIVENWSDIAQAIAAVIGAASIIVKLTPTLKDDNILLPIVKFLGKYIALNHTVRDEDRPQ
jgi:hypothetical protein